MVTCIHLHSGYHIHWRPAILVQPIASNCAPHLFIQRTFTDHTNQRPVHAFEYAAYCYSVLFVYCPRYAHASTTTPPPPSPLQECLHCATALTKTILHCPFSFPSTWSPSGSNFPVYIISCIFKLCCCILPLVNMLFFISLSLKSDLSFICRRYLEYIPHLGIDKKFEFKLDCDG